MINNNDNIRVERGSLRRQKQHQDGPVKNTDDLSITANNPNINMFLLSSQTILSKEPFIDADTLSMYPTLNNNLPQKISPMKFCRYNMKNINLLPKTNISIYQKKFKLIEAHKKLPNIGNKNILNFQCKLHLNKLFQQHIDFAKLIIFDFDDTLFPTSAISRKQLKSFDANPLFYGETKQLYYNFKALIDIIISLFNSIKKQNGKTYIVTNASYGWIKGLFSGYFSGVIARLFNKLHTNIKQNNIQIISARDKYFSKYKAKQSKIQFDGEIAKKECMENIFKMYTKNIKMKNVANKVPVCYCVGDGFDEFNASKTAWNKVIGNKYISILQRIKFIERPSIELLMEEIQTVESLINEDTNKQFIEWILNKKYVIDYV